MLDTETVVKSIPWLLPVVLLLLKFGLKLWISEKHSGLNFWKGILQSPVDVGFLALSLVASSIIKASEIKDQQIVNQKHFVMSFIIFIIYIFLIVISIVLWKATPTEITKRDVTIATLVGILNYTLTIGMLVYGIVLLKQI